VQRPGQALVDAQRLAEVVRAMTDDAVSLETDDSLQLHVRGAKTHFKLLAMKPTDFPPFPEADQAQTFSIRATDLRRMVAQTVIAAAKENGHYAKAAVLFRTTPGQGTGRHGFAAAGAGEGPVEFSPRRRWSGRGEQLL
jgi:DNA polymerase-3 subunit beta